ncbi:sporulation protein YunB [Acetanaerobacterium elongatum]|uniref:Sporulation protein YunB n=2 Tax=Acetanaerobacterium elongatum TaxID=258515 RepID=A0A1H0ATE5_9FIRM|nr:sporulation protein YunB [Acetanaerobacterium elongatum]
MNRWQQVELKILITLVIIVVVLIICDIRMRPVIKTFAEYEAKIISARMINDAVCNELENNAVKYNDIITLSTDSSGAITAIQTNSMAVNILKSRISAAILEKLSSMESTEIKVHLGTLLGAQAFMGRGPNLPFKIVPTGDVSTDLSHSFEAAGINQTRHQILLSVNVTVTAVIAGTSSKVVVPCNFLIVDTIIVGKVPNSFTDINGDNSSTISKINDYADQK